MQILQPIENKTMWAAFTPEGEVIFPTISFTQDVAELRLESLQAKGFYERAADVVEVEISIKPIV